MTGPELKKLIELSDYTVTALAKEWNVSREHLQREVFKYKTVPDHYVRKAQESGLMVFANKIKSPVASVLVKDIDRLGEDIRQLKKRITELRRQNRWQKERLAAYRKKFGALSEEEQPAIKKFKEKKRESSETIPK